MKSNKELKNEYKLKKLPVGVFKVVNKVNGKILIDESPDALAKWNRHQTELRFGSHRNKALQEDWNNFGPENFEYSLLSSLEVKEGENVNIRAELRLLKEMVIEELKIDPDLLY